MNMLRNEWLAHLDGLVVFRGLLAAEPLRSLPAATSLSVAGVSASRQRVGQLRQAHPGALLENMEGFAVALACARQGIACVEVRSVSNRVGPRAPHETDFPGAMRRLADIWRPAP